MSPLKKSLFAGLLLLGILALTELTASLIYYFRLPETSREALELSIGLRATDAYSVLRYVPHPYFNYISNPEYKSSNGYKPHNAAGLRLTNCCRTPKEPGEIRLVAVGGSTTYGMNFTKESAVWPGLLEKALRNKFGASLYVINAGVPYYTTFEIIGMMAMRVPEFLPDVILIHTGLNDAFTVGYPDEGGPDNRSFRHAWTHRSFPPWLQAAMRTSYLVRLVGPYVFSYRDFVPGDMASAIQYSVPSDEDVLRNAKTATGRYFRRNVRTMITLAKSMNAVPILINEPLNPAYETGQNIYFQAVVKAVLRNNDILRELAMTEGALYIDLYSKMRDPQVYLDAAHVNQIGMQSTASYIAPIIASVVAQRQAK
jgi:hypothetical protein